MCRIACISICVCICFCFARVNQSSDPSMEWHTYNYSAEYVFNLTIGNVSYKLSRSVSSLLHKKNDNKIKGLPFGLFFSTGRKLRGITRRREYVNFLFEWQKQYQTSERSKPVRYLSYHENIKFISFSHRLIFFLIILTINIRGWDCKPGFNINTGY